MDESTNVFGEVLETCSDDPTTGFFRDRQALPRVLVDHGEDAKCRELRHLQHPLNVAHRQFASYAVIG